MQLSTLTSKGQVTIPQSFRQQLSLTPGQAIVFDLQVEQKTITLRAAVSAKQHPVKPGFGLVKVKGKHAPADWDVASLLDAAAT